jgi:hypothetical protein
MSKQSVFNKSVLHVLKQGKPSGKLLQDAYGPRFQCEYLAADGGQCAAAPFIEKYVPDMEHKPFRHLVEHWGSNISADAREHSWLVAKLQEAHDNAAQDMVTGRGVFLEQFKTDVRRIAIEAMLDLPEGA